MVVLVADDDPIFSQTLQLLLVAAGAREVLHAADGLLAQSVLSANIDRIDAIILDLRMPNGDGVGFLRAAKYLHFAGKLIILSGEDPEVIKGAKRLATLFGLQCEGALNKPLNPLSIISLVSKGPGGKTEKRKPVEVRHAGVHLETVLYQPRIDIASGVCTGAEALSRFIDNVGRPVHPETAIALAEEDGSIDALTWQITDRVLQDAQAYRNVTGVAPRISINVSADTLSKEGFVDEMVRRVNGAGLAARDFIVELTETRLVSDAIAALENLTRLRILDFGVALDDFGTGHSNAQQLGNYPFNELKLDKQFAIDAPYDRFAACFLETTFNMARDLGIKVVVEGVETPWVLNRLKELGLGEAQGFYFAKPISFDEFVVFSKHGPSHA